MNEKQPACGHTVAETVAVFTVYFWRATVAGGLGGDCPDTACSAAAHYARSGKFSTKQTGYPG